MSATTIHELAVKTDTELAKQYDLLDRAERKVANARDDVRRAAGQKSTYVRGGDSTWSGKLSEAIAVLETPITDPEEAWRIDFNARVLNHMNVVTSERTDIEHAIVKLNEVYTVNGGWSRFFLVKNNNGHVHSSMSCHTTFPTTLWGWLPQLSGLTEAEAVADQGEILCSVCFPSAPVAWTSGESKVSKEAKAERAAAKVERDAKKLAKMLRTDGTVLRIERNGYRDTIETIHAAKAYLTECYSWYANQYAMNLDVVAEELAARTGETVAEVKAAARKRAAKRVS